MPQVVSSRYIVKDHITIRGKSGRKYCEMDKNKKRLYIKIKDETVEIKVNDEGCLEQIS